MRVDLLFFFDSEDYETPASDEGELWWAKALSRHGLTGCFNLVGEEARALRDRGRRDVLAALSRHEIGYHSNLHSRHPVHLEYLEGRGWDEGVAAVLARESAGVADVRELTGQHPVTYCKPGSNWTPHVLAAMTRLGVPTFCDSPFEWSPGHPLWYCGSFCVGYHTSFDHYFNVPAGAERRERMRADFLALLAERQETGGVVGMYTHPCRLITAAFPDNFTAGQNPPRSAWRPAPSRPRAEIEALKSDFDDFLGWIAKEADVRVTNYGALHARHRRNNLWLDQEDLRALLFAIGEDVKPVRIKDRWLSAAEQLGVLLWVAGWKAEHGTLPEEAPVRPLLGPDRLAAPANPRLISTATLLAAGREASYSAGANGRVPALTRVDGCLLGPGALRWALADALREETPNVALRTVDELPELARREDFAGVQFQKTWSILPPEFEAPGI
ncbi:MAG TPA: hypothetical protein VFZ25_05630, partial [Chloroflexota bacterium]|nr:hypothetical protein [Chloroflexota bacterium]